MEQQLSQYQENINKLHGQPSLLPMNDQEVVRHQIMEAKVSLHITMCATVLYSNHDHAALT